jgi:dihydrofolate reductase
MRKIVLMMSVSLDGFIEGPNREIDWHLVDDEPHDHFNRQLSAMGAFPSGRVTHELMARFWPTADEDPASTRPMVEFSRIWRDKPKDRVVQDPAAGRLEHHRGPRARPEEIQRLKARPGGDLSLGGADLAAAFMRHDLIDEHRIYVHPVVTGRGKPLFPAGAKLQLRLAETRPFGNGVVLLHHRRPTRGRGPPGPAPAGVRRPHVHRRGRRLAVLEHTF